MESYSSRKFQGLGWAVNSLRARATSQRQARTAALQDKFNAVALQQQKADTTRRAGEKSVASIFGTVPMVSAPLLAKFGKQAYQGLRQRGQDLAELKAQRLGGRTEGEANYDDDLEETMGKFEDSGIKPEAEGYLEDEDVPGTSTGGGTTSAEPASGDFSTANSDLTDDFSGIEPGDGDEVEQPFSLTKGFLGPSNPTEAAQQSTEYSNTFNEGQIDMANDVANELRGLPGGSYTTNASGEFVPMEQEATGFFGRLNSRMGNTLAKMGGMEPASESSGVETVDYARASDFDTSAGEGAPAETNTAFETPASETDISGYTTSDVGAESTDFGSAPEIPQRVSSLSRFGGNADEIGTSLARQQASTGDSTLARLGQSGTGSGDPPEAEIVENMRLHEPTASDIDAMPSSSEAGASSSETSGLSGAESAASRVNPDTLTGTIGEESDFGGVGAETGIEAGAEAGIEAGAEVVGDSVVEGLDIAAAVAAPIPGADIVLGVIAGVATLASVGYSIYEAVHSGQQGNAPPPAQIASVPTPQPNIAGHYVGASGENVYNQPQHFQGF
jgi:hypothetical protein